LFLSFYIAVFLLLLFFSLFFSIKYQPIMSFRPPKALPILSIFHNARNGTSRQALAFLQERQQRSTGQDAYKVDVINDDILPTKDQVEQIASYLHGMKSLVAEHEQEKDVKDTEQLLLKDPTALKRPMVVDWENAKAATSLNTIQALIQHRLDTKVDEQ
jgi:arsenate reductase-like glutaredoxin family protein